MKDHDYDCSSISVTYTQGKHMNWYAESCIVLRPIAFVIQKTPPTFVTRNMVTLNMTSHNYLRNYRVVLPYSQLLLSTLQLISQFEICCNFHALLDCEERLNQIFLHDVAGQLTEELQLPGVAIGLDNTGHASRTRNKNTQTFYTSLVTTFTEA